MMNWYKIANLEMFELDDVNDKKTLIDILNKHNLPWDEFNLQGTTIVKINVDGEDFIIDDMEYPQLQNAVQWIYNLSDQTLYEYIQPEDFSENFWNNVNQGESLYHATIQENIPLIKQQGLNPKNKTRGINNRSTPSAIFTSMNPDNISSYGNDIVEINIAQMKQDGYMPTVSLENPIEEANMRSALAHKLQIDDYDFHSELASDGMSEDTVIFYEPIPPKYLTFSS